MKQVISVSPRPNNPPPDRRAEILTAALRTFARRGYATATNTEIAREAGVTAAALYYYFPSKADLFRAAVTQRKVAFMPALEQLAAQLREIPPTIVIPLLLERILTFVGEEETQAVLRIMLAEGPRSPELVQIWQEDAINQMVPVIFAYLEHQMAKGTIRRIDPRTFAMLFAGPILFTILTRDLVKIDLIQGLSNETLLQEIPAVLFHGLILPQGDTEKE